MLRIRDGLKSVLNRDLFFAVFGSNPYRARQAEMSVGIQPEEGLFNSFLLRMDAKG